MSKIRINFQDNQTAYCSLDALLAFNEGCKNKFHDNSFFRLVRSGQIDAEKDKNIFFEYYQEFSNQFQRMIFLRSALCDQPDFQNIFTQHFEEEYGHDRLLQKERTHMGLPRDPILQALCAWFPHKMLSTTPAEQLIIANMCIESAAVIIHRHVIPLFDPQGESAYYKIHEEHDCHHERMGLNLLKNLSPKDYERLIQTLQDAWSIVDALMARIGQLVVGS